jgi:hypothetical protein
MVFCDFKVKYIFILFAFLILACGKKETDILFSKTNHSFDTINLLEEPKVYFKYKNTGSHMHTIDSITHSCGCTIPTFNDLPLPPNHVDSIQVEYDSQSNKGHFIKEIMVYSNAANSPHKIFIKGFSL